MILILVKVALHLRWLTTEKFQNYEIVKGGCIPSKNKSQIQRNNKLRWLASDINFKLLHTGCLIAHVGTSSVWLLPNKATTPKFSLPKVSKTLMSTQVLIQVKRQRNDEFFFSQTCLI